MVWLLNFMSLMKNLLLFVIIVFGNTLSAQIHKKLFVQHSTNESYSGYEKYYKYLIADSVSLRAQPSATGKFLKALPVGTKLEVLERKKKDTLRVNGIYSNWYKVKTATDIGWVWGGFIAQSVLGSNEDPKVNFLVGYDHVEEIVENEGKIKYTYYIPYIQVRAIKEGKQVGYATSKINKLRGYIDVNHLGKRGIKNIHDILTFRDPCEGGCGCSGGTIYFFWDGKNLAKAAAMYGTADAEFSSGQTIIFPSNTNGDLNFIKVVDESIDDSFDYNAPHKTLKRVITTTYYTWNGKKLIESLSRKPEQQIVYYSYEKHKVVPKPTSGYSDE